MRNILFTTMILILLSGLAFAADIAGNRILMIIAPQDFKDVEYSTPRRIFENSGAAVDVASLTTQEAVGEDGLKVIPDMLIEDVQIEYYDGVVVVGGSGISAYYEHEPTFMLLQSMQEERLVMAGICEGPELLARVGVLEGRQATVCSGSVAMIKALGAYYWPRSVVRDGNIVTANSPWASKSFAYEVVKALMYNE